MTFRDKTSDILYINLCLRKTWLLKYFIIAKEFTKNADTFFISSLKRIYQFHNDYIIVTGMGVIDRKEGVFPFGTRIYLVIW